MAATLPSGGRRVVVVPDLVIHLSKPFFRASPPHNGRVPRIGGRRRGPVLRSPYGTFR